MQCLLTKNLIMISPPGINLLSTRKVLLWARMEENFGVENKMHAILRLTLFVVEVESYKFVLIKNFSTNFMAASINYFGKSFTTFFLLMNRLLPFINEQEFSSVKLCLKNV